MVARLFVAVPLGTVLFILGMQEARSEVGVFSPSGQALNETNTLGPGSWYLGPEGCRVGKPGNLVVTPFKGSSLDGGEILNTDGTGPQLCSWLTTVEKAHNSMRNAWEGEHARRRSLVPKWNLWQRFQLWRRSFPEFKVHVLVRYLDLWNNDRFGHAMPWIAARFVYVCPESQSSYGLLDHLCNSVFSQGDDHRVPETVYLLLQPRQGYNQPLKVEADAWQYVAGVAAGLRPSRDPAEKRHSDGWAWASSLYGRAASFMTITGNIDDCWMFRGYCYFKSLLRMEWKLMSETVCERLHRDANENVFSAVKAARLKTVQLNIVGLDFFSFTRPALWAFLDEGIISVNVGSGLLRLQIDTNPENAPNFKRAKSTTQNVRAASLVVDSLASIWSKRNGKRP